MLRFDLTCNIALRVEPGQRVHACVLPASTEQQRILHEVIWVEGCDRWTTSLHPDGTRELDLVACQSEVRVAFAVSLTTAPVWCHAAALWEQPKTEVALPRVYSKPNDHWWVERMATALGPVLRNPAAVFAALPELFEWLRQCHHSNELTRYEGARTERPSCGQADILELAIPVFGALGVPARIVAGFAPESARIDPHDARALNLELYGNGRWWMFEPDGQVPAFGFIRTAVGCQLSDLPLVRTAAPVQLVRMDASIDPPPAWGLPLRTSTRLLLSLDAQDTGDPPWLGIVLPGKHSPARASRAAAQEIQHEQDGDGDPEQPQQDPADAAAGAGR